MPARDVVGAAFVEILPDVKRFARQLRRDLKKAMADVQKDADRSTAGLSKSFDRAGRNIKSSANDAGRGVSRAFDKVPDDVTKRFASMGNRAHNEITAMLRKARKTVPKEMGAAAKDGTDKFHDVLSKGLDDVVKDFRRFGERAGKEWTSNITKSLRKARTTVVKEATQTGRATGRRFGFGLSDGLRKSKNQARKAFIGVLDIFVTGPEISLFIRRLGTNILFMIGGLAAAIGQAVGQLIIGPLLTALGSALAFLPGIIATVVASFLVFKSATRGVGEALKFTAKEDLDEFNKAIKRLAPSARQFAIEVRKLANDLHPLQQALQNAFFRGTGTQIALIAKSIAALRTPIIEVGAAINGAFLDALRFARSIQALTAARGVLEGIRDFFVQLRPAITPLLAALAGLAKQAGAFGGQLGKALSDLLIKFSNFLSKINLVEAFENIKIAISAVMPIFKALSTIFSVLDEVATAFRPALDALTPVFRSLGVIVVELAKGMGPGLGVALRGLADGLKGLAPAARPVGEAIGNLGKVLGPLLTAVGPLLANALIALASAFSAILISASPFIRLFSEIVRVVSTTMMPVLLKLVTSVLPPLADAAVQVFEALNPIIPVITTMTEKLAAELIPQIPLLTKAFVDLLPSIIESARILGPVLVEALTKLAPHIPQLAEAIIVSARAFIALASVIGPFLPLIARLIGALVMLGVNFYVGMVIALKAAGRAFSIIVSGPIAIFRAALRILASVVRGFGTAVSSMYNVARARFNSLTNLVRSIPGKARSALGNARNILYQAGRNIIQGLINGILSKLSSLRNTISSAVAIIRNNLPFSPAKIGPLSGRGDPTLAGARISDMIAEGISKRIGSISAAASRAMAAVDTTIGGDIGISNTTTERIMAAPARETAPGAPSPFLNVEAFSKLIAQDLMKAMNGMEWRFVDVDKIVSRSLGRRANIMRRA